MCAIFEQRGKLSDNDFDTFNIPPDDGNTEKDHLVISRQRSILFTYDYLIQRSIEEKRAKEELLEKMRFDIETKKLKKQEEKEKRKLDQTLMQHEDKYSKVKKKRNMTPKKEDLERKSKARNQEMHMLETACKSIYEI